MKAGTSLSIRGDLKDQLTSLKHHPKESYSDVIERLLGFAVDDVPVGEDSIRGLEESLRDIRQKRVISEREIMKKYGVT